MPLFRVEITELRQRERPAGGEPAPARTLTWTGVASNDYEARDAGMLVWQRRYGEDPSEPFEIEIAPTDEDAAP